eukprot:2062842-Amphidinium_carterae.1
MSGRSRTTVTWWSALVWPEGRSSEQAGVARPALYRAIRDGEWDKLSKVTSHIFPVWWQQGMDVVEEPTDIASTAEAVEADAETVPGQPVDADAETAPGDLPPLERQKRHKKNAPRPVQIWHLRWAEAMKKKYRYPHPMYLAIVKKHVLEIFGTLHVDFFRNWRAVGAEVVPAPGVGGPRKIESYTYE